YLGVPVEFSTNKSFVRRYYTPKSRKMQSFLHKKTERTRNQLQNNNLEQNIQCNKKHCNKKRLLQNLDICNSPV
ncbi:MAG: hypothetical protein IKA32_12765, partial [Lentisphaeria bacterium]|nr:hypothetical protein [Lentisphaeria bacterium]